MAFIKKNEGFTCENCGHAVAPRKSSCRNHCPVCLHSKHVDIDPGDRANPCRGLMSPIGYEMGKKGMRIRFRCLRCGEESLNISALYDEDQPDSMEALLKIQTI